MRDRKLGHRRGPRALKGARSSHPRPVASFKLPHLKLPDSSVSLLPSKTMARTATKTGSDRKSLMAGPEGHSGSRSRAGE